jgi:hypothetical protein
MLTGHRSTTAIHRRPVVEHPRREQAVMAGHHVGHVFDRLAGVETDLFATCTRGVHRLHDGHLID